MITRRALMSALAASRTAEWVVVEREQELGSYDDETNVERSERRHRFSIVVHHDTTAGRGTARIERDAGGDARDAIRHAVALAHQSIGRPWRGPPPAAPAKVVLEDPTLESGSLPEQAREIVAALPRNAETAYAARVELLRERVRLVTHAGFERSWTATSLRGDVLVRRGDRAVEVTRHARTRGDLDLPRAAAAAAADLDSLGRAGAATTGRCAVILTTGALLHDGGLGLWRVFAEHADAALERRGLARYRPGAPVAAGADRAAEPLGVTSDGVRSRGLWSAPVADDAGPVRRFTLIERGVAVGLGLSVEEAARRGVSPNGGVRNLVVSQGTWNGQPPPAQTLEVLRLAFATIDASTGAARLGVRLGLEHGPGGPRPVTDCTLDLDLIAGLAAARRSNDLVTTPGYEGPGRVWLDDVPVAG